MEPADRDLESLLTLARKHLDAGEHRDALALLDQARGRDPRHAETFLLQASCLLALDQPERALPKVDIAARYATGPDQLARVDGIRSACLAGIAGRRVEEARGCLRAGDAAGARQVLRRYEGMACGDEFYAAVLAYATPGAALAAVPLERVLRWLTREELAAAGEALRGQRYDEALAACRRAHRLDRRGALAALRFAQAIAGAVHARPPDPRTLRSYLSDARRWLELAAADPDLRLEREPLAAELDAALRRVDEQLEGRRAASRQLARVQADDEDLRRERQLAEEIDKLYDRYDDVAGKYFGRPLSPYEIDNMHSALASIGTDLRHLRHQYPADSPAGRDLANLARAIDSVRTIPI